MRHYEIVALVHPDQSEQQDEIINRYRRIIEDSGGKVHRCEDWGRRKLAYPIQKLFKAGYFLMNVECDPEIKAEVENVFRYNDSIIRSLILRKDGPVTEQSPILKQIIRKKAEEKELAEKAAEEARLAEEARVAEEARKAQEAAAQEAAAAQQTDEVEADTAAQASDEDDKAKADSTEETSTATQASEPEPQSADASTEQASQPTVEESTSGDETQDDTSEEKS